LARTTLCPYTTLFRSRLPDEARARPRGLGRGLLPALLSQPNARDRDRARRRAAAAAGLRLALVGGAATDQGVRARVDDGGERLRDRKSTRLNSSHVSI